MSSATCYYPNGNPSPGDIPCGNGDGVACCPQGWTCEANGLCHLADPFYYGRYTCTDKSWQSSGCPNVCTQGKTAAGDEAILECSSGSYCCDANRPDAQPDGTIDKSKGCCETSNERFSLAQLPLAPGGSGNSGDSGASSSSSASSSTTAAPSSFDSLGSAASSSSSTVPTLRSVTLQNAQSSSSSTSASSDRTSVVIRTSVIQETSGGPSTLVVSTTSPVSADPVSQTGSASPTSSSGSKSLGSVIGPAVGVPVAVLALAALGFFLLWRRRRGNKNRASSPPPMQNNLHSMYGSDGKDLVDSPYTGKSELEGSPNMAVIPPAKANDYHTPDDVRGRNGLAGSPPMGDINDSKPELAASNSTRRSPQSQPSPVELPGVSAVDQNAERERTPAEMQAGNTYKPYRPSGLGLSG